MKKETFLKILVAILSVIIIVLLIIIIFVIKKPKDPKDLIKDMKVSENCIANRTVDEINKLATDSNLTICGGLNKFKIKGITLDGKKQNIYMMYYKGTVYDDNTFTGIYINDKRAVPNASPDFHILLKVADNYLFATTYDEKGTNLVAFDSDADKIFDLSNVLEKAKIKDPAFSNGNLQTANIDYNSIEIGNHEIIFNTKTKNACQDGSYSGSTFKITYEDDVFHDPVFVSSKTCN